MYLITLFILITCLLENAWYVKKKLDFTEKLSIDHSWQFVRHFDDSKFCCRFVWSGFKPGSISELPFASVSKRVFMWIFSYKNVCCLLIHYHANQTHFVMKGFARRLVLKQRHKATQKTNCKVNRGGQEETAQPDYHLSFWCLEILFLLGVIWSWS